MPRVCVRVLFFATSLMLSRHSTRRDHPPRGLRTGLFINHVRGVKGLQAYWGTNNNLSITGSIGRIIKIGALRGKIDSM